MPSQTRRTHSGCLCRSISHDSALACFHIPSVTLVQVRAGEGESERDGYVLTNPVAKTSMSSGLSKRGTLQVHASSWCAYT
jgi:hypothetical protein